MLWKKFARAFRDTEQDQINVGAGAALNLGVRAITYILAAITGIVIARALGPSDRGVYSLVIAIAAYSTLMELGVSKAGIYFTGQKTASLQRIVSNNLAWLSITGGIWALTVGLIAWFRPPFVPDDLATGYFVIFAFGGILLVLIESGKDAIITSGSIIAHSVIEFLEPFFRFVLIVSAVLLLSAGVLGVLWAWLFGLLLTGLVTLILLGRRVQPVPHLNPQLLRKQFNFGIRGYLGFVLQSINLRLDVFLVAALLSTSALGLYAVAFGLAELLWQIPFALGTVFFPRVAAMDAKSNAEFAAITCRRALFITLLATIAVLPLGRVLIETMYGSAFSGAVAAFYILAPSAMFYTVHRVLSGALAGLGMPEATIYGGLVSVPMTIGLNLLLIPMIGIEGAALASLIAYATNAGVILFIFARKTGQHPVHTLFINREDVRWSLAAAREFFARPETAEARP